MNQSNSDPSVSIVIPLFNKEKEVLRAVNSVLSQTVQHFEVIIVNDGSTDKGPDLVRAIKDPRIKIIDQANSGVSAARNRGIAESHAELIAFLDADDEWGPDFFETILGLKHDFPECSVFATSYFLVSQNGLKRPAIIRGLPKDFKKGILKDYFKIAAQSDPPLWTSTVVVEKGAILSIDGFPDKVKAGEDLLTWARLASKFDIAYSTDHCAVFWQDWTETQKHRRIPEVPDIIGKELSKLFEESSLKNKSSLKRYISLWHVMRASIAIQYGFNKLVIPELKIALRYSKPNIKILVLFIFSLLPEKISTHLLKKLMSFKRQFREYIFRKQS